MNCAAPDDVGSVNVRYSSTDTVYVSKSGTGELVYMVQFPATVDDEVTEYAVKRRLACKYGVLWFIC